MTRSSTDPFDSGVNVDMVFEGALAAEARQ